MKRACGLPRAGAAVGLAAFALAWVGCSSDSNPVLPPDVTPVDGGGGGRGVQNVPDASPVEATPVFRDAADVPIGRDAVTDATTGIDVAPAPRVSVTILEPRAVALDGGVAGAQDLDGGADGGAAAVVVKAGSRFAPKVAVEVESRGGDATSEVLTLVTANLFAPNASAAIAPLKLNQTQYTVVPESATKSYLFSDTPLDLSKVPSGFYDLRIDATTEGGATGTASISIYIDGGPSITFLQPAENAYVKGSVIVTAIVSDSQAGVAQVTFSVGQTELPTTAIANSGVQYTATIDFNSFAPPLDGPQLFTVTAVNGNNITSLATLKFNVDNAGPVISATKPASGDMIGRIITIEASVTDPAGVMPNSVVAVVAHGDVHFEVVLAKGTDGTYRNIFDTTQLATWALFPSISFRAQDVLGNQSSVGYLVSLDNTPPTIDLDPPATFRLFKKDGTCSWPFDPVGPDAVDDGSVVTQLFDIRARIEDDGNMPQTGKPDFVIISGTDPASVKMLILDDTSLPLVVDTSDPPDGVCDDVNPELVPSVSPQSSKDAQLLNMVSLNPGGVGNFTSEPGSSCHGGDAEAPAPVCPTTYSIPKGESMSYVLGYAAGNWPAIWTIGPIVADNLQCAGRPFDASNNLKDGWACVAVEAADGLGNKQVSRPIRVCIAAQVGSKACSATALGRTALLSLSIPSAATGKLAFVTKTALLDGAGAAVKAGDNVIFTGLGHIAIAGLAGAHQLSPADTTGKSFSLTDVPVAVPVLVTEDADSGALKVLGAVGVVLTDGKPVHVVTSTSTALDPAFNGKVLLTDAGVWPTMKWSVSNVDPSGFDLKDSSVDFSSAAVLPKVPDCTGTIVKQAPGLAPKVDASKPCRPWSSFDVDDSLGLK